MRRVLWICLTKESITAGFCIGGQARSHWTYHSDGSVWLTKGDAPPERAADKVPLSEVKGADQFVTLLLHSSLESDTIFPRYTEEKSTRRLDSVYYVDPSLFVHGGVACTVYLVEPHEADQLARLMTRGVAHVFTDWKPWIAVVFSHVKMS
ncbi:MAG: hypothetical protein KAW39_07795 [Thermoplasmata archaeon]|nr:hypothetical protein [Thermoplasmata archaeon]